VSDGFDSQATSTRLNTLLASANLEPLDLVTSGRFALYCELLLRWNARTNLTAIRDEEGVLSRHFLESIACARLLPSTISTLLDFGSGAGFPGIPIALCRPEIAVTLAESQNKKAAFLREAVRTLGLAAKVHSARAELLPGKFHCVTLRAVDNMPEAVRAASSLVRPSGWLAAMTTERELVTLHSVCGPGFTWSRTDPLPGGNYRILAIANSPAT
jgi:16S rRNA (guanine527-N7)-methyltransferase